MFVGTLILTPTERLMCPQDWPEDVKTSLKVDLSVCFRCFIYLLSSIA